MAKTFNAQDLLNAKTKKAVEQPEKAEFLGDTLHCVITDENGNTVLECDMAPRSFKAKEDKRNGSIGCGIGWYADVRGEDSGSYRQIPVTAGLRLSLDGVKVAPGDTVDLRDAEQKARDGE